MSLRLRYIKGAINREGIEMIGLMILAAVLYFPIGVILALAKRY